MRNIKIFGIFLLLFFLTGCTVNYSYDIDNNIEEIELLNINSFYDEDIEKHLQQIIDINSDETNILNYYTFDKLTGSNESGVKLSYNYDSIDDYIKYSQFLKCYTNSKLKSNENRVNINLIAKDDCDYQVDELNIKLKVTGKLVKTNADRFDNNVYSWNMKDEYEDILLIVEKNKETKNLSVELIYILGGIIISIIIVSVILINKKNKSNEL